MKVFSAVRWSVASPRTRVGRARTLRNNLEGRLISPPNHPIRRPESCAEDKGTFIGTVMPQKSRGTGEHKNVCHTAGLRA